MSYDPPAGIADMNLDYFDRWMDRIEALLEEIRDRLPPAGPKPCMHRINASGVCLDCGALITVTGGGA